MDIIITIPDEHVQEVKRVLLAWQPKPENFEGTDFEWIKQAVKNLLKSKYISGKQKLGELDLDISIDVT